MLNPSMQDLMKKVNNRYLLVNLAAQRARDIALNAEAAEEKIPEKPVKIALDEIASGKVAYCEGAKPETTADDVLETANWNTADEEVLLEEDALTEDVTEEL
jgi:DNA-directed RNA polymerase omega subunit